MAIAPLDLGLTGDLLDLDYDELGGDQRREAHQDVHDSQINTRLRIVFGVAFDEVGALRRGALEGALQEESLHEGSNVQTDLPPQRLVVGLEDDPLRAVEKARLEE